MCCLADKYLYSNSLSAKATISILVMSELFPPCFSCNNTFILLQSSLGLDDQNVVFQEVLFLTEPAPIAGNLSNFIEFSFLVLLLPVCLTSSLISSRKSNTNFLFSGCYMDIALEL